MALARVRSAAGVKARLSSVAQVFGVITPDDEHDQSRKHGANGPLDVRRALRIMGAAGRFRTQQILIQNSTDTDSETADTDSELNRY